MAAGCAQERRSSEGMGLFVDGASAASVLAPRDFNVVFPSTLPGASRVRWAFGRRALPAGKRGVRVGAAVRTGTQSTVVHVRQGKRPVRLTDVPSGLSDRQATRKRWYFAVMGLCLVLILLAWNLVRFYSTTAAVVMSAVAAVLPPIAAVVANWHEDN